MRKIHSPNAYTQEMSFWDIFRISSVEDYRIALTQRASHIRSREDYETHLRQQFPLFRFQEKVEDSVRKASDILSLSIGDGNHEYQLMRRYTDKAYTVSDIADPMLGVLKAYASASQFQMKVVENTQLPFSEEAFDCVLALNCEYFYTDSQLLKMLSELHRVCRKGGRVLLSSYTMDEWDESAWKRLLKTCVNQSTLVALLISLLSRRKISVFTGYSRTLSDFIRVFQKTPFYLEEISFEGGHRQPEKGRWGVLFVLRKHEETINL